MSVDDVRERLGGDGGRGWERGGGSEGGGC